MTYKTFIFPSGDTIAEETPETEQLEIEQI